MRVRMNGFISGTCGWTGKKWPAKGHIVELPYEAAQKLVDSGMAVVPEDDAAVIETATRQKAEELAVPPAPRGRPKLPRDADGNVVREPKKTATKKRTTRKK